MAKAKYRLPSTVFETLVFGALAMEGIGHPPLNIACDDWHGSGCWTLNPMYYGDGEELSEKHTEYSRALHDAGLGVWVMADAISAILARKATNGFGPHTRVSFEELAQELGGIEPFNDGTEGYGEAFDAGAGE